MTMLCHELKQGLRGAVIWAVSCSVFVVLGMGVFPRIKNSVVFIEQMLQGMGPLAQAFAMDKLDLGQVLGYYAANAANVLALGGGLYAAILGMGMLAKEEGRHTAEFLFPHPISRLWVLVQKYAAMLLLLALFCVIGAVASWLSLRALGEVYDRRDFVEMQVAIFLLMWQLAAVCFGISAFLSRDNLALGIGLTVLLYFMLLMINMQVDVGWLKWVTPYYYYDTVGLVGIGTLERSSLTLGLGVTAGFTLLGFIRYLTKDLRI